MGLGVEQEPEWGASCRCRQGGVGARLVARPGGSGFAVGLGRTHIQRGSPQPCGVWDGERAAEHSVPSRTGLVGGTSILVPRVLRFAPLFGCCINMAPLDCPDP